MCNLFGGGKSSSSSTLSLPPEITAASKDALNRARTIADRPYQTYGGPRVAPLSAGQQTAIDMAQDTAGVWQPMLSQARDLATTGGQPLGMSYTAGTVTPQQVSTSRFDQAAADRYMNPFIKGALDPARREMEEASARARLERNASAVSRGAFGGSRQAIEDMRAEDDLIENIGDLYATGYAGAFDRALGAFTSDEARALQAAGMNQGANLQADSLNEANRAGAFRTNADIALGDREAAARAGGQIAQLGALGSDLSTADLQRLLSTGALERGVGQQNLDLAHQDFLEQRDWDLRGLDTIIRALSGTPYERTTTTAGETPPGSVIGQLGGLGLAAYGLLS